VAAVEPNRINLMTVHASKGLEFKHVILPRMHDRARVTSSEELTFHESKDRWAIRVPYGDDQAMTGTLAETVWLERFRELELEEHARVLYVAMTRAIESVFLSWTEPARDTSWAKMAEIAIKDLSSGAHSKPGFTYEVKR